MLKWWIDRMGDAELNELTTADVLSVWIGLALARYRPSTRLAVAAAPSNHRSTVILIAWR
jgi:hypothetical protein